MSIGDVVYLPWCANLYVNAKGRLSLPEGEDEIITVEVTTEAILQMLDDAETEQ